MPLNAFLSNILCLHVPPKATSKDVGFSLVLYLYFTEMVTATECPCKCQHNLTLLSFSMETLKVLKGHIVSLAHNFSVLVISLTLFRRGKK